MNQRIRWRWWGKWAASLRTMRPLRLVFALITALLVALAIFTNARWIISYHRPTFFVLVGRGVVSIYTRQTPLAHGSGFLVVRVPKRHPTIWWIHADLGNQNHNGIVVPLWMPAALTTACALLPLRRRPRPGACARCGYDPSGLSGGVCPECGRGLDVQTKAEEARAPSA